MRDRLSENGILAALLTVHIICCGGILLAAGVITIGGLTAWFTNAWGQITGLALAVLILAIVGRRLQSDGHAQIQDQSSAVEEIECQDQPVKESSAHNKS